ncbi:MAG: diguanylate cyclase [Spirochaetota bacterium]
MEKLNLSLLYIEDDKLIQETSLRVLETIVEKVYPASDGEEGLELFQQNQPDIILTDIDLPKMNGIAVAKKILASNKTIPVIFVTAYSDVAYLLEAIQIKVHGFIIKPLKVDYLYSLLTKITHEITLEREIQKNTNRMQTLLNLEANMVLMADENKVYEANHAFLEFFSCASLEEWQNSYTSISNIFLQKPGYICSESRLSWLEKLKQKQLLQPRSQIQNPKSGIVHTFLLKFNQVPDEEILVLSLTDITEIESQTKTLQQEAITDQLTGLYNRRKFNRILQEKLVLALQGNFTIALLLLDIDHFKSVNDTFGHDKGDIVLVELAKLITNNTRTSDLFARWGGEEFVILVCKTPRKGIETFCKKLLQVVREHDFQIQRQLTISIGVVENKTNDSKESIFKRADDALYIAKNSGRNCYRTNY